jgi:hypothetical protein
MQAHISCIGTPVPHSLHLTQNIVGSFFSRTKPLADFSSPHVQAEPLNLPCALKALRCQPISVTHVTACRLGICKLTRRGLLYVSDPISLQIGQHLLQMPMPVESQKITKNLAKNPLPTNHPFSTSARRELKSWWQSSACSFHKCRCRDS